MEPSTKEYLLLFNTITNMERTLETLRLELIDVQRRAEELYLERAQ